MYARMGTFEVQQTSLDEVAAVLRDQTVLEFSQHEGFLGYQAYVDRERGRLIGVSLWTTRAALEASRETGRRAVGAVAALGAVVVGDMQILEVAFDARPPEA